MPGFVFLSGPECGDVASVDYYGIHFPRGEAVDVLDAFIVRKLRGNRFWSEVPEEPDPDTNEDGITDKAELIAMAEAAGVEVDKRWGVARLRAALGMEAE